MRRDPVLEAGGVTRQEWRRRRTILVLSLLPLILAMLFRVWLGGGTLGLVLTVVFTVVLLGSIAIAQRRARVLRQGAIERGGAFEAPAILRIEQLMASPRFDGSVKGLNERLRRRGWGKVGGSLTADLVGVRWVPDRPSRHRGVGEMEIPWADLDDVELIPMVGVGGGVGLELHLAGGASLSVHTADADALRVVLNRYFRSQRR